MRYLRKSFSEDKGGAAAAEYALIVALISTAVSVAGGTLGLAVSTAISDITALF